MQLVFLNILLICAVTLFSQKPVIDQKAYANWDFNNNIDKISSDGKYVVWTERLQNRNTTTYIQSTNGNWKTKVYRRANTVFFSGDNKSLLYIQGKDSLAILKLGTSAVAYFTGISDVQLQKNKNGEWISYSPIGQPKSLVLRDINLKQEKIYTDIERWKFSEDGMVLLLWKTTLSNTNLLQWIDMSTGKTTNVWEGERIDNPLIDSQNKQLVFKLNDEIWLYKHGIPKPESILNPNSFSENKKYDLVSIDRFSKSGRQLFLTIRERKEAKPENSPGIVEVWSYTDVNLPTIEAPYLNPDNQLAVVDLINNKAIAFDVKGTDRISFPRCKNAPDDVALVSTDENFYEKWSIHRIINTSLLSINTGEKKKLGFLDGNRTVTLSASGKYLCYFNSDDQNYYSYEIATGEIRNLTKGLPVSWIDIYRDDLAPLPRESANITWFENDKALLVYDRYDIWKLDPSNKSKPVNLTNAFGKRSHIVFSLALAYYYEGDISGNERIYLSAFNIINKDNGFYAIQLKKPGEPQLLTMGPVIFNTVSGYVPKGSDFAPLKAKNAEVFFARRMSATEAPNYFSTRDFKTFTRLTASEPQKDYNWYTTELHTWKSLNGQELQGILYKPENFDPNKKYPLIFQHYERKSDGLNAYIQPEPLCNRCNINIPTYVSQGYLVFTPDIYYKIGDPMQGTYDAVVSAAKYIKSLPFVDGKKMGVQGCSYGGLQTNYLVTHTDLFAAAASSSGLSNYISAYGSLAGDGGYSQQDMFETGQNRMGGSLWDKPDAYIKSSSILYLNKVTTPLLIMHTKKDVRCHFDDAVQLLTGLRRLGKKSWMLAYSEGNHGLSGREADDFSIRMMQFFDHYLKDKPAPAWMLNTISFSDKGTDAGLKLDTTGIEPGPGILKTSSLMNN